MLEAMDDMRFYVANSFRRVDDGLPRWPFRLDSEHRQLPSRYEIDVVLEGVRHQYGFVLDGECIHEEWAVRYPHGKAARIFSRHGERLELGSSARAESRAVERLLRPNALFLSAAGAADHPVLGELYGWFRRNFLPAVVGNRPSRQKRTINMLERENDRDRVLSLLRAADLGIVDAHKLEPDPVLRERLARAMREMVDNEDDPDPLAVDAALEGFSLVHRGAGTEVELQRNEESLGTLVWLGLIGPVVDALNEGSVLLADELDASLHPALVERLIELFQSPTTNPRRAQLIFNSHDPTILGDSRDDRLLGRDQTWFTEKLDDGSTRLYSLLELDPRKHEAVGRRYLEGRYGAVPILSHGDFDRIGDLIADR